MCLLVWHFYVNLKLNLRRYIFKKINIYLHKLTKMDICNICEILNRITVIFSLLLQLHRTIFKIFIITINSELRSILTTY